MSAEFFFYRNWIFQSLKEKEIVEEWSKERKAKKERKKKQQEKQNTKSRTPKTAHIVRKIIIREREKIIIQKLEKGKDIHILLKLWQFRMQTIFLKISPKWSRKLDFTLSINKHVWYKNFSQTLTFFFVLKRK